MRAEEACDDRDPAFLTQPARCAEHPDLAVERQAVAGFDLDRRGAFGNQCVEPCQGLRDQIILACSAGGGHCRHDPAACARDFLVTRAGEPQLELVRPVSGVNEVGVAIDQPRSDPAAFAVDPFRRFECRRGVARPGIDDAPLATGNHRVLDLPGSGHGRHAGVQPDTIAGQAGLGVHRVEDLHVRSIMSRHNNIMRGNRI